MSKIRLVTFNIDQKEFDKSKITPVQSNNSNFPVYKPMAGTGLWFSPVNTEYGWKDFCLNENFRVSSLRKNTCFHVDTMDARVFFIDNEEAVEELEAKYSLDENRESVLGPYSFAYNYSRIDYEKLSQDYDVILATADFFCFNGIIAWDCQSGIILNPDVIQIDEKDLELHAEISEQVNKEVDECIKETEDTWAAREY